MTSKIIAGIDVGNATTEITLAQVTPGHSPMYLCSGLTDTTGVKGTSENVMGICSLLNKLLSEIRVSVPDARIDRILINDATPVIADFAMDTITETIVTDSAMIGHNPDTPGGIGLGSGITAMLDDLPENNTDNLIVIIPRHISYDKAASLINDYCSLGVTIKGAIVQKDEGTLINNRLNKALPIVDEVANINAVPMGMQCAVEVAPKGHSIKLLSDPYGLATIFNLSAEETDHCRYVAKALIGNKSAVVIKTPESDIKTRVIPSGSINIIGERFSKKVPVDSGASHIMSAVQTVKQIKDVEGEPGTNIGGMLKNIKLNMAEKCEMNKEDINISDIFATDSYTAVPIKGGIANEYAMENGVAIAAMIKTNKTFMDQVASALEKETGIPVEVGGIEGDMAFKGVLTTPGTELPVIMLDIGAGSTDAAFMDRSGKIIAKHLAGAGSLITMLINSELHLESFETAEMIKKYPLAKVDNLYRIRYENGDISFFEEPLSAEFFGQTVVVSENNQLYIVDSRQPMEKIRTVRREVKRKILLENTMRALNALNIDRDTCNRIVLVGGSVEDFELSDILTEEMDKLRITSGKGNIRGCQGPRNAVATGLIINYFEGHSSASEEDN